VSHYFSILAGWFMVSAFPIGSTQLSEVFARFSGDRGDRALEQLRQVHEGMFDYVRYVDPSSYPWGDRIVTLHDVGSEYGAALRAPTLREHVRFLLTPGPGKTDGRSWLERLCGDMPDAVRASVVASFHDVRDDAGTDLTALREILVETGAWELLRHSTQPDARPATTTGEVRLDYARTVLRSALEIVDELAQQREQVSVGR
jgi:hypothetical protein